MTAEAIKELETALEQMAKHPFDLDASTLGQAEELLTLLASALFADVPERQQLTWPERKARAMTDDGHLESLEERLERAESRFRTLVEQIPAITFMAVLGEGENEVYVSPHVEQILGYTQQEWLSDPFLWYYRLHPDDRAMWNAEFARGCRTGGPFRAECRVMARDGHTVWVLGEARVVKDALGRPQYLQGVAFDITESKKAQQIVLETAVRTARMQEELEIARRVQTSLLPAVVELPGLEFASVMLPADEVGGDYFDIKPRPDGAWLAIGDVSGHGLNAGLVMLMVQSAVTAIIGARAGAKPREVLTLLNDVIYENIAHRLERDEYVTMCLLKYQRDGQVVFAGAHQDILVCRKATGRVERVVTTGTWLGIGRHIGAAMQDSTLTLHEGDVMVLFTDGIIEAMNSEDEQFDLDRLCEAIRTQREQPVGVIRDHVIACVRQWTNQEPQEDDMTLLVMRYHAEG